MTSFILISFATKWRNTRKRKLYLNTLVQWQQDYCLAAGDDVLFWEYLEIGKYITCPNQWTLFLHIYMER